MAKYIVKRDPKAKKTKRVKRAKKLKRCKTTDKHKYATRAAAQSKMQLIQDSYKGTSRKLPVRVYKCPDCNMFHMTNMPKEVFMQLQEIDLRDTHVEPPASVKPVYVPSVSTPSIPMPHRDPEWEQLASQPMPTPPGPPPRLAEKANARQDSYVNQSRSYC